MPTLSVSRWFGVSVVLALLAAGCVMDPAVSEHQREAKIRLAEAFILDSKPRAALFELLDAEKKWPRDAQVQFLLGLAYEGLAQLELARGHYENALSLRPGYSQARNNLAVVLIKEGRYDQAIAHLKRVEADLLYATPHFAAANLAWAYYQSGQPQLAEKYYRAVLEHYQKGFTKDPTYVRTLANLGRLLLDQQRPAEALEHLNTAAMVADLPEIHFERGRAYLALGDRANARQAFGRAQDLSPKSAIGQKAKAAMDAL